MIDPSTLPYVDLSNSPDALRLYAQEHFGKKIHPNAAEDTVRERFAKIYKEETGKILAPYDPEADPALNNLDEDDDQQDATTTPAPKVPKFAVIVMQEDPLDPHDVKLGHNFVAYTIWRNEEVKIPHFLVSVLRDAKKEVFNPKTLEKKEVPAYPFSIVDLIYDEA